MPGTPLGHVCGGSMLQIESQCRCEIVNGLVAQTQTEFGQDINGVCQAVNQARDQMDLVEMIAIIFCARMSLTRMFSRRIVGHHRMRRP